MQLRKGQCLKATCAQKYTVFLYPNEVLGWKTLLNPMSNLKTYLVNVLGMRGLNPSKSAGLSSGLLTDKRAGAMVIPETGIHVTHITSKQTSESGIHVTLEVRMRA